MNARTFVVIPTYHEANNIAVLIRTLNDLAQKHQLELGIVVVDDNSSDGTASIVRKLGTQYGNIILIERVGKLGLGSAVREGMARALAFPSCRRIITMDADFSHDPNDIPRLIADRGELVIGSRYVAGGKIYGWGPHRKLLSRGANTLCRLLLRTKVRDNTANFRLYSTRCAEASLETNGRDFEWIVLALVAARRKGFRAHEVPVTFINRKQGASKLRLRDILRWVIFISRTLL